MGLGGISFAVSRSITSAQRGKSAVTKSTVVYDLRSNCAAGMTPLWQAMQYFATNGRTVLSNCRSRVGVAATAGNVAITSRMETARSGVTRVLFHSFRKDQRTPGILISLSASAFKSRALANS